MLKNKIIILNNITAVIDPRKPAFPESINAKSQAFSEALMKRHYIKADIQFSLTCNITQRFVAYTLSVEEGIMASISYYPHTLHKRKSRHYAYETFAKLSLDDQIEAFLDSIDCYLNDYGPHYRRLKAAVEDHLQIDENRLSTVGLGLARVSADKFSVELAWDGFGNNLEFGRQYEANNIFSTPENMYDKARVKTQSAS